MAEMEGPEMDTNDGTTNPSVEASVSVEPMLHSHPQGMPPPALSLPLVGPTQPEPPSFRPLTTPTYQTPTLKPQLSPYPGTSMMEEHSIDQRSKLDSHVSSPTSAGISTLPAAGRYEAQASLSSELSDLDSEA
jgi:hypothetical protein